MINYSKNNTCTMVSVNHCVDYNKNRKKIIVRHYTIEIQYKYIFIYYTYRHEYNNLSYILSKKKKIKKYKYKCKQYRVH